MRCPGHWAARRTPAAAMKGSRQNSPISWNHRFIGRCGFWWSTFSYRTWAAYFPRGRLSRKSWKKSICLSAKTNRWYANTDTLPRTSPQLRPIRMFVKKTLPTLSMYFVWFCTIKNISCTYKWDRIHVIPALPKIYPKNKRINLTCTNYKNNRI